MSKEIEIIERDITTVSHGIICHQVNCQGVMGAGVALAIAKKWPIVKEEYKKELAFFEEVMGTALGEVNYTQVGENLFVANIFGQDTYGKGKRTIYDAVNDSFVMLKSDLEHEKSPLYGLQVYCPWMMGCNRGGGDWDKYRKIIEKYVPNVIYCKWKG